MNPILSVVIITYNQENYIAQTLDSILNQKHNYSFEIVIGDDCSVDNTRKIINKYATEYPNIIVPIFNEVNLGIVKNYFNVLEHTSGKYIMECAGDDWWLPEKINIQINFMELNSDVGLCYGKVLEFNENKHKYSKKIIGKLCETASELLKINEIPALSVCFKRELAMKYISTVNPLSKDWLMEDYPMWLWFAFESKIKMLPDTLGVYRLVNESGSHFTNIDKLINFNKSVWNIKSFYSQKYLNKQIEQFDIHSFLFNFHLLNGNRIKALEEAKIQKNKKSHIKVLLCSNTILFYLFRKIQCLRK